VINYKDDYPFDEKKLRDLIKTKEKELAEISGAFIIINASKLPAGGKKPKRGAPRT
jgi:hypothetical protein